MALEWKLVHPRKELQNIVPHYEVMKTIIVYDHWNQ